MAYESTSFMFRSLTDDEEREFREYARTHDPEKMENWTIYHPICRDEWEKRGIHPMTDTKPYQDALTVQDACNLSGVVRSWANHLDALWAEARERGEGTDYVNRHPVNVLFASKVADLTRCERDGLAFSRAYQACKQVLLEATDGRVAP